MSVGTTTGREAYSTIAKSYSASPVQPAVVASAQALLDAANNVHPFSSASHILDLGCGPGTLTAELVGTYRDLPSSVRITAVDSSAQMITQISATKAEQIAQYSQSLWSHVYPMVCDAQEMSDIPSGQMSHILAGIVLFLLPDSERALQECHRVLEVGGTLALSCWPKSDWQTLMQLLPLVRPDKPQYKVPPAWRDEESVREIVTRAGFNSVRVSTTIVNARYDDPHSFCKWMTKNMPGLRVAMADFSEVDEQRLEQIMVDWLVDKNGGGGGDLSCECIICVAKK